MGRFSTDPKINGPQFNQNNAGGCGHQHHQSQAEQQTPQSFPEGWPQEFPNPTVAIDLEGIVFKEKAGKIVNETDIEFKLDNIEAIRQIRLKQHKVLALTAFPEMSRGNLTQQKAEQLINYTMNKFGEKGIFSIDSVLFAGSDLKEDEFAIPNTGMLKRAKNEMHIDMSGGYYVGDNIKVLKAADKFGLKPILIKSSRFEETMEKLNTYSNKKLLEKTKVFNTLQDFVDSI